MEGSGFYVNKLGENRTRIVRCSIATSLHFFDDYLRGFELKNGGMGQSK